ncbi:Myc-type basic helix-loop-helix (bHLH) domain [Trinorchestia longiramus]|nr:Myc-type basic helix-loop-helix (bHLH) domain [Trinorchestia longiramus]
MKQISWQESVGENVEAKQLKRPRRSNKPAMERRRRERINGCLEQLKNFVLVAEGKDPARYTKVEKADILEMTVRFLTAKNRRHSNLRTSTGTVQYKTGYEACIDDLKQILSAKDVFLPPEMKERLFDHLHLTAADKSKEQSTFSDAMAKEVCHTSDLAESITIHTTLPGGTYTGKLAINCSDTPHNQTVYIPPSNTWSPPIANTHSMDGLYSPPSSPESARAHSPASPNSNLTCTVLQPHDPNTGKLSRGHGDRQYCIIQSRGERLDSNTYKQSVPELIKDDKILMQTHSTNQSEMIRLQFPCSPSVFASTNPCQQTRLYPEPQSVPLNLTAPKPKIKKEEEVVVPPQYFRSISPQLRDRSLVRSHPLSLQEQQQQLQMMYPGEHWRPWFN